MLLKLQQIIVKPGQQMLLQDISWQQLENILEEMGERRAARISYSHGWLEIMVPLPEHEKDKEYIGELVRVLLDKLQIDFEPFGSTTLKNERMRQAVEPDTSFYIQNQAAVIGKNRIDLNIDPPPDLAIENKNWLVIFLIFSIAIGIYLSSQFIEILPLTSKNPTQIPSSSILVTPSPVISESPTVLLQTDTFREAVNKAIHAANLTQSAKSPDEWKTVVTQWEAAIALMKTVPSSSPNYVVAQQKIIEYQKNPNYADKNAIAGK